MARDQVDMTPIETREELIAWFEAGSKPKSQFRIGTEHEKFVFTVEGHNPRSRSSKIEDLDFCPFALERWR